MLHFVNRFEENRTPIENIMVIAWQSAITGNLIKIKRVAEDVDPYGVY